MSCYTRAYPLRPSLLASLSELSFGFGPHLYRSTMFLSLSCSVWVGTTPISICYSSCQFQFSLSRGRTYIDWSCSHHFRVQFELGPHLYRSVIHPVSFSLVWVGAAPISTAMFLSLFMFSLSQGRTYIDRPCSYHFSCSVWVWIAPISIGHSSYQF